MMLRSTMFLNLLNAALICLLVITPQIFDSKDPSHGRNETVKQRYIWKKIDAILYYNEILQECLKWLIMFWQVYFHLSSCNTSRMFHWNSTWYPETQIGDCCSLDYDANITQLEYKLDEMYDLKNGSALEAIKNGFLDFLQGITRQISDWIQKINAFNSIIGFKSMKLFVFIL